MYRYVNQLVKSQYKVIVSVKGYLLILRLNDITLRVHASELWDVTCYMGSHSVTCHPTQVNASRLTPAARKAGTRSTYPGGMEG